MVLFNFFGQNQADAKSAADHRSKRGQRGIMGRKRLSLTIRQDDAVAPGGVFMSVRTMFPSKPTDAMYDTASESDSANTTPASSWKSSGTKDHNKNMPLVVSDLDHPEMTVKDEAEALGRIMARSRHLPGTWYYSSNHIMVNQERARRTMAPLVRLAELDALARQHADRMAEEDRLFHSTPVELQENFSRPKRRLGENVSKGANIRDIHKRMMGNVADRNNMLDRRYTHMGMATARAPDGELYLCQIFRG